MLDRGEQLGWFDSSEIVLMAIVSATAFYFFIAHSLTTERPFIPIEIFRDRNFIVGLTFMFVMRHLAGGEHGADGAACCRASMGYPILDAGRAARDARPRHGRHHAGGAGPLMARIDGRILLFAGPARAASSRSTTRSTSLPTRAMRTIVWVSIAAGRWARASCSCR